MLFTKRIQTVYHLRLWIVIKLHAHTPCRSELNKKRIGSIMSHS